MKGQFKFKTMERACGYKAGATGAIISGDKLQHEAESHLLECLPGNLAIEKQRPFCAEPGRDLCLVTYNTFHPLALS